MMIVHKSLEQPAKLAGLPLQEFGVLVSLFLGLAVLGVVAQYLVRVPSGYYLFSLVVTLALYGVLLWAARKGQPQFLASWLAFQFVLPKHIEMDEVDLDRLLRGKEGHHEPE